MNDLISRADAIEAVQTYLDILINSRRHGDDFTFINVLTDIRNKISALPSAEGGDAEILNDDFRPKYMQPSPNGADLISRADAIEELCTMMVDCFDADEEVIDAIRTTMNEISSAEAVKYESTVTLNSPISISAEAVQGEWVTVNDVLDVYICDQCGEIYQIQNIPMWHFCPNCGARMNKGGAE